jgi:hypothetical protein
MYFSTCWVSCTQSLFLRVLQQLREVWRTCQSMTGISNKPKYGPKTGCPCICGLLLQQQLAKHGHIVLLPSLLLILYHEIFLFLHMNWLKKVCHLKDTTETQRAVARGHTWTFRCFKCWQNCNCWRIILKGTVTMGLSEQPDEILSHYLLYLAHKEMSFTVSIQQFLITVGLKSHEQGYFCKLHWVCCINLILWRSVLIFYILVSNYPALDLKSCYDYSMVLHTTTVHQLKSGIPKLIFQQCSHYFNNSVSFNTFSTSSLGVYLLKCSAYGF